MEFKIREIYATFMVTKPIVMRCFFHILIIALLLCSSSMNAQTDISVRKKDFKAEKEGFKEAWKHVKDGDTFYTLKDIWYANAFDEYLQAVVYNNSNPELNYKTGVSALFSDRKEEAAGFFLKAAEIKNDVTEDVLLYTGRALQYSGRFSEAVEKLEEYMNSAVKKSKDHILMAKKWVEECNSALKVTKDTLRIGINNLGSSINSNTDEYAEIFSAGGNTMFFASRRKLPKSIINTADSKFDENIYLTSKNNGTWELARTAGNNLVTEFCETPLYINSTSDILYIYAGYENGGDIMMSEKKKGDWKSPQKVPFDINSGGSETSFTFSPAGNEIYFVTDDGKDNFGGKDIYSIKKLNERRWSKPQNAGPLINSEYDEESVRFSKLGDTLWFSSKGHNTIGGFDIFYSVKNQFGAWDSVKNYGYPVNTVWDEVFYYPAPLDDSSFYFVSNRSGGFGGLDIYHGRILPPEPVIIVEPPPPPKPDTVIIRDTVVVVKEIAPPPVEELILFLIGTVKDSETGEPVAAKIDVIDLITNNLVTSTYSSGNDGSFRVRLPEKKSYMINLHATGFLSDMKSIDIPDSYSRDFYNLNALLIKVSVGKKFVLNNILFETGKSVLTQSSYAELNKLFNIMLTNPQMKIEISGHTDKTGSETVNFRLSGERAKAVVDYLVQMGVAQTRMEFRGYGSLQPIDDNATPQGRANNRRVEFKILEF